MNIAAGNTIDGVRCYLTTTTTTTRSAVYIIQYVADNGQMLNLSEISARSAAEAREVFDEILSHNFWKASWNIITRHNRKVRAETLQALRKSLSTTIDVKRTTSACGKGAFYSMMSERARHWADDSGMGYCIVCLDGDLVNTDGEAGRIDGGQAELERAMSEYDLVVEG